MTSDYRGSLVISQPYKAKKHLLTDNMPINAMICSSDDRSIIYPNISICGIDQHFNYNDYNDYSVTMTFMIIPW